MSERQDFIALDWVAGEIEETLKQAGLALESYIANRDDNTKLRFCVTHIHQVQGTLQMVEFFGAALLAEEMESLAQALSQGSIKKSNIGDAIEVLQQAINQLPRYLEKVKESRHGLPATLLPVLNDLRAVRGESLLSETVLFTPDIVLSSTAVVGEIALSPEELTEVAHKLRQMFQIALLGLIRGNDVKKNLNFLAKVCARLAKLSDGFALQSLWRVCIAVLEGLLNGSIASSVAVKILLRQVDQQIKLIIDQGATVFEQAPPEGLLKNLLYYVARSKSNSRFIKEIQAEYKLDKALLGEDELGDESLATADSSAMRAVVEALAQELNDIQIALAEAGDSEAKLADVLPLFRRVSDTMAILGMGSLLKKIQEPYTQLARVLASQDPIERNVLEIINNQVTTLQAQLNPNEVIADDEEERPLFNDSEEAQQHLDKAFESVLRESRNGLEQCKESIIEFVANQWDHTCLEDLPALLKDIHGSLMMVPLAAAANVISSCENYVSYLLADRVVPEWQMLDTLADAITSIDYYLERLVDENGVEGDAILEVAMESVAELGYPVAAAANAAQTGGPINAIADNGSLTAAELAEVIPILSAAGEDEPATQSLDESATVTKQKIVDDAMVAQNDNEENKIGSDIESEFDPEIDPEIVEIFVEEAGEVLETINEFLPLWQADIDDTNASTEVRRAFHTLKGSGRMVGATDIGGLGWAIENMLNRVLDSSIVMDQPRFDLVAEVVAQIPALVAAFEQRQSVDQTMLQAMIDRAEALAKEQYPVMIASAITEAPQDTQNVECEETAEVEEEIDTELLEIFATETGVHGQVLDNFISHCKELAGPVELSDELQRALHTLKGSANMAGIMPVAMVVTPLEYVVKELRASQLKVDQPLLELLERGSLFIKVGIEQLATTPLQTMPETAVYVDELHALLKYRIANAALAETEESGIPPEALNSFLTESLDLITEISGKLVLWQQHDLELFELPQFAQLMYDFIDHAKAVNMHAVVEFSQAIQVLYRRAADCGLDAGDAYFDLSNRANDGLIDMLDQIAGQQTPVYDDMLMVEIQDFEFDITDLPSSSDDTKLASVAITETPTTDIPPATMAVDLPFEDEALLDALSDDLLDEGEVFELDLGSAVGAVIPVDSTMEFDVSDADVNEAVNDGIEEGTANHSDIELAPSEIEDNTEDVPAEEVDDALTADSEVPVADDMLITAAMTDFAAAVADMEMPTLSTEPEPAALVESLVDTLLSDVPTVSQTDDEEDDFDEEIIEIFLEEADDLLENIDEAIHGWNSDRSSRSYLDDLLRILHTLKGGARLARLTPLGNLSHNFETSLMGLEQQKTDIDDDTLNSLQQYQDQLLAQVTAIKAGEPLAAVAEMEQIDPAAEVTALVEPDDIETAETVVDEELELDLDDLDVDAVMVDDAEEDATPVVAPQAEVIEHVIGQLREVSATQVPTLANDPAVKKGPQEVVKVSAHLLGQLVNLAGETSISRGRAEEQISELVFSLDEMQITVDRLQEQVRRLDMETEQQILFRQEQVESEGLEGFDPLEMDRYSQLQQLSRSLLESSSDLIDIKTTLADKSRDMETLLIQQSRINTELQEGLMRSQMVPFSRMVPRLRRIIRQVSGELGKKVDFHLDNVEGELDRSVLERMVAPLEHMLRNAVDHGIESADQRREAGKSSKGSVTLDLAREGGEIVLTLTDDGAGINLEAVKKKALERGLIEPGVEISDREIMQFILQSGFSTAAEITQISGRGVGMDVVHSEIKQLGGSMDIDSAQGKGSKFTVRLPFTVSVNRALMVSVGGDSYAIPLNSIEGIVRVSPFELEAYYQPDSPMFDYAGQPYLLRYMGALLQRGALPNLEGQSMPLPVILVRGAEHSVAVQVDSLLGSREIVVKPLGPQFSMVQGLTGATVLGDGSVVVILDLLSMIRADALHMHRDLTNEHAELVKEERNTLVMVVDDSVTVRKVTSRFLERQGMDVITAKDGADAVAQLLEIEQVPDVMLLDIEMPRMDGFEVASRVKHNSRLKHMPIIMITSRTGEKHRERAMSLGVDDYMGKPYQETMLLETIQSLVGAISN
ncbi:MAG: chemosensory pili system protein ChpA (sensor histidine kinase/response regulator) [Oceanicoccus sp.]|jgi:chemosensory pili system protein ChpA (sensor histidine kinase/response regulator)